jgi:hypothetical protein
MHQLAARPSISLYNVSTIWSMLNHIFRSPLLVVLVLQNGPCLCGVYFSTLLEEHTWNELCTLKLNTNFFFFCETQYNANLTNTYIHSPLWTHARTPYPYELLRRLRWETDLAGLEINEVSTHVSLSIGTSSPTERILRLFIRHQCVKPEVRFLVGWGCHYPPNHPSTGWFPQIILCAYHN